jgi:hypothetical protein
MSSQSQEQYQGDEQKKRALAKEKEQRQYEHEKLYTEKVEMLQAKIQEMEDLAHAARFVNAIPRRYKMKDVTLADLAYKYERALRLEKWHRKCMPERSSNRLPPRIPKDIDDLIPLSPEELARAKTDARREFSSIREEVAGAQLTLNENPECEALVNTLYDLVVTSETSEQRASYIAKSFSKINTLKRAVGFVSRKAKNRSRKRKKPNTEIGRITRASSAANPSSIASTRAQRTSSASFTETAGTGQTSVLGRRTETDGTDTMSSYSRKASSGSFETAPM